VPDLVGEVVAEEATDFFGTPILAVEESSGGEIVGVGPNPELLVGGQVLVWVVLSVAETRE
jgi:hypothetical protein